MTVKFWRWRLSSTTSGWRKRLAGRCDLKWKGRMPHGSLHKDAGLDNRRCQLIWDTVALNSTPSIALYKEAEIAVSTAGIALDWGGWGYESLPQSHIAEIVDVFPRLEMKERFTQAVCRIVETRPASTYDNFARDFGERFVPGYKRPSVVDFLMDSPFRE